MMGILILSFTIFLLVFGIVFTIIMYRKAIKRGEFNQRHDEIDQVGKE